MKIHEMELLVRVAQTGSMTLAAQQLNLSPAAVSATIARHEDALGLRLFERTTRTLHLTDEGAAFIEGCQDILTRWHHTLELAQGQRGLLDGEVHLAAPADTAYTLLSPALKRLCDQHPKLRVVLNVSDSIRHLHRDAIDMAIRYGTLQDNTLTARRLLSCPSVLVASPEYVRSCGEPGHPGELRAHRCLTFHIANNPLTTWRLHDTQDPATQHELAINSPLCSDGHLARRWALEGQGITLKSLVDVIDDLEHGRLLHILPRYNGGHNVIHVVFPSRRFLTARVRALDAAISAEFELLAARCEAWISALESSPRSKAP